MKKLFAVILLLLIVIACSEDEETPSPTIPDPVNEVFDISASLSHAGDARDYLVHLPSNYYEATNTFPLILAFHGGSGSPAGFAENTQLNSTADKHGFIVVYPGGFAPNGIRTWNAGSCCGPNTDGSRSTDDVGFVSRLIDELVQGFNVDDKRVYATGTSNGGMLTYRLLCELSHKIAAIAPNAAADVFFGECPNLEARPILHTHSKLDEIVSIDGSASPLGFEVPALSETLGKWQTRFGCDSSSVLFIDEPLYQAFRYNGCQDNTEILYYITEDGGHSWPGGTTGADPASNAFMNNELIWDFFSRYALP
ncbi:MAG: PHB depolymerase family esterase [Bacteroidota bacterium]